jgi:hypothetical protein
MVMQLGNGIVRTSSLPRFASDLVEQALEIGASKGRYGWDDPELCSAEELEALLDQATRESKWQQVTCYGAMLAALEHNSKV